VRPARALAQAVMSRSHENVEQLEIACTDPLALSERGKIFCVAGLAGLDRNEAVLALINKIIPDYRGATPEERDARWLANPSQDIVRVLYWWQLRALRADPGIIPVFDRLGLIDYWRSTGEWPDFCESEPESVCRQLKAR
jgi:hypothetical protein